jgi:hypothetical protein
MFSRNPLTYTPAEFETIIEHFRKNRHAFTTLTAKSGGSVAEAKKSSAAQSRLAAIGMNPSDIAGELDL